MRRNLYLILIFFISFSIHAKTLDDLIADRIFFLFLREYDNVTNKSFLEKVAVKIGRSTYLDALTNFKNNYKNLDTMTVKLHPRLEYMAKTAQRHLNYDEALYFRKLLERLSLLSYKSFYVYYLCIHEYFIENKKEYFDFEICLITEAIAKIKFYKLKKEIYIEEKEVRKEICRMLNQTKLKNALPIYRLIFNYFDPVRNNILEQELKDITKNLIEKKIIKNESEL